MTARRNPDYAALPAVRRWVLWYADGSTFSSDDGPWRDAPRDGVQVQVLYHTPPYKTVFSGEDAYFLPGERAVKRGRWMETAAFYALQSRAMEG